MEINPFQKEHPTCFISYSCDSSQHIEWVVRLASDLRKNGIDCILDIWDLKTDSIPIFMQKVYSADFRCVICTPNYKNKAELGQNGAGEEFSLITQKIFYEHGKLYQNTTIPILKNSNDDGKDSIPLYLGGIPYVDFRKDDQYEDKLADLLRKLSNTPEFNKPELGKRTIPIPKSTNSPNFISDQIHQEKELLNIVSSSVPSVLRLLRDLESATKSHNFQTILSLFQNIPDSIKLDFFQNCGFSVNNQPGSYVMELYSNIGDLHLHANPRMSYFRYTTQNQEINSKISEEALTSLATYWDKRAEDYFLLNNGFLCPNCSKKSISIRTRHILWNLEYGYFCNKCHCKIESKIPEDNLKTQKIEEFLSQDDLNQKYTLQYRQLMTEKINQLRTIYNIAQTPEISEEKKKLYKTYTRTLTHITQLNPNILDQEFEASVLRTCPNSFGIDLDIINPILIAIRQYLDKFESSN